MSCVQSVIACCKAYWMRGAALMQTAACQLLSTAQCIYAARCGKMLTVLTFMMVLSVENCTSPNMMVKSCIMLSSSEPNTYSAAEQQCIVSHNHLQRLDELVQGACDTALAHSSKHAGR